MPACDVYRLQAFVDGQLSETENLVVAQHLEQCPDCAQFLVGLQAVVEPLRLSPEAVPEGLQGRLLEAVAGLRPLAALDCAAALEFASVHLDGELPLDDCRRLNAHLDACSACSRAAAELGLATDLLRALEPEAAPPGLLLQIQAAVAAPTPHRRPVLWQVWTRNLAGVAAAAALLVALLTNVAHTPAPMLAQPPASGPATSVATVTPTAPAAPVVVAAAQPAPTTFEALRHAALRFAAPEAALPVRRGATAATGVAVVRPAAPARLGPQPVVAPTPQPAVEPRPAPVAVAVTPARPEETPAPREVAVSPPARVEAPAPAPVVTFVAPAPVRVAVLDKPKATPEIVTAPKPAHRPTWVSRPAADEREVYVAERDETRLAEVRSDLNKDSQRIRQGEVKGFVIH